MWQLKTGQKRVNMAKLLVEQIEDFQVITEEVEGKKNHYIQGIFMQAATPNKNGRVYPKPIMEAGTKKYIDDYVSKNRAVGTLGHEATPRVSEDKVSHLITNLKMEGNDVYGKAKVLDTLHGKELKALIEGGVSFGVSSRAVGSLKNVNGINEVQSDFAISCVDAVLNPSAIGAWVEGIMESSDWRYDEKLGIWQIAEDTKNYIKKLSIRELEEQKLSIFENYMLRLATK